MAVLRFQRFKQLSPKRVRNRETAGGARGGMARLECNQMPRKALQRKACGLLQSKGFPTAEQWESNGIFQADKRAF